MKKNIHFFRVIDKKETEKMFLIVFTASANSCCILNNTDRC